MKKRTFLDLFSDKEPKLKAKFMLYSDESPITVLIQNKLGEEPNDEGKRFIETICNNARPTEFREFCSLYSGFEIGTPIEPQFCIKKPLLRQIGAEEMVNFTKRYMVGGKWAWVIDLNKSKTLYRNSDFWIAFAEIGEGPACLTIFLEGENAGQIYLVTAQPHFNILRPVAKNYSLFLDRIAKDPAAFLKMVRSYVIVEEEGRYGFVPIEYLSA